MDEQQSILDATEYVLMALNNIKNYEEFIEYKEEIIKAIYDIRNSITNLYNLKKFEINNNKIQQDQTNSNNINPSSISSMLGLKFNYDAYLNNIQINNYSEMEQAFNNRPIQEIQNNNLKYINNNIKNNEESIKNIISDNSSNINNNNQNNLGLISFQDENNDFEPTHNNEDNIAYNKSIRNKFKIANNDINNNISSKNNINKINNMNSQPIKKVYQIQENNKFNNKDNKQKGINKKEKLSLIADIIMKINSEDYFYEILTKLFGDDLTDKLMSSDVSDELLDAVQNSIKEIEELKRKDDLKIQNKNYNNMGNPEEIEEQPKRFPIEQIMNPNVKQNINRSNSNKKINSKEKNNYQELNPQKNLKNVEALENSGKNNKKIGNKNNNSSKKEKPFISATSAYGNYFDPPLQKGGFSKLDEYKKIMNA